VKRRRGLRVSFYGMSTTKPTWPRPWEPLTPHGVAAFAGAPLRRLLLTQLIVALLAAGAVGWFLEYAWLPIIRSAIHHLPAEGEISEEELHWHGDAPALLAGNHFLGIGVDLNHSGQLGREAELQVEFGRKNTRVFSMLGYEVIDYPPGWRTAFNRTELEPWWGAREPWIVVLAVALTLVGLMVSWFILATLYCVPVKLITLFENRDLGWGQSWKLAGAALMPGALFMTAGVVACGLNLVDLIQLGSIAAMHIIIGWIYLFISPLFLPRPAGTTMPGTNPFSDKTGSGCPGTEKNPNPFRRD
jgi:hypothetical protein